MRRSAAGYSLFELVILIVVLGVVCYFIFLNQSSFEEEYPEDTELVAAEHIRIGIHNYAILSRQMERAPIFPVMLDEANQGDVASPMTPLFTTLYPGGIRSGWKKMGANQYIYLPGIQGEPTPDMVYFYDASHGTFKKGLPTESLRFT